MIEQTRDSWKAEQQLERQVLLRLITSLIFLKNKGTKPSICKGIEDYLKAVPTTKRALVNRLYIRLLAYNQTTNDKLKFELETQISRLTFRISAYCAIPLCEIKI